LASERKLFISIQRPNPTSKAPGHWIRDPVVVTALDYDLWVKKKLPFEKIEAAINSLIAECDALDEMAARFKSGGDLSERKL
jgi:hypothetical protein